MIMAKISILIIDNLKIIVFHFLYTIVERLGWKLIT